MFDSLLEQIPASFAIILLILMVSLNFSLGIIRLIYLYYEEKAERTFSEQLEEKVDDITKELKEMSKSAIDRVTQVDKTASDAKTQIEVIIAHYDSEVKFRKMLEDKVNNIEKQLQGNGKPSISTEIELLKQKVEDVQEDIKILTNRKTK